MSLVRPYVSLAKQCWYLVHRRAPSIRDGVKLRLWIDYYVLSGTHGVTLDWLFFCKNSNLSGCCDVAPNCGGLLQFSHNRIEHLACARRGIVGENPSTTPFPLWQSRWELNTCSFPLSMCVFLQSYHRGGNTLWRREWRAARTCHPPLPYSSYRYAIAVP